MAELDVLAALAQVAAENNYCRPTVDESDQLTIVEGRHPVVEQMLKGSLFVPNDTTLVTAAKIAASSSPAQHGGQNRPICARMR